MRKPLTLAAVLLAAQLALTGLLPAQATAADAEPAPSTFLLPTGEQVTVRTTPGGQETFTVRPVATKGMARALVHLRLGGHDYEVPGTALPYLGRGLDLSMFDLDALRAGAGPQDARAARAFGDAVNRQFAADAKRGHYGGQDLFAGATPPRQAQPRSVMRTLTVKANDIAGKPADNGVAFLYNTDDGSILDQYEGLGYFFDGTAKFSVPAGHYSLLAVFWTVNADGQFTQVRLSAQPDFTVNADRSIRADASRATSKVTWVTPRKSVLDDNGFHYRRAATAGPAVIVDMDAGPGVPVWVSPVGTPVRTGALQTFPHTRLISPPGPGTPYEYQLQQAAIGTIPQQRYVVRTKDIATVDESYYSDRPSLGDRSRIGHFSFDEGTFAVGHPIELPRRQTAYLSAAPDLLWLGSLAGYLIDDTEVGGENWQYDAVHGYVGGSHGTENWTKAPLHPVGDIRLMPLTDPRFTSQPAFTRGGDLVRIKLTPFTDDEPGHYSAGFYSYDPRVTTSGQYKITQNGETLAEGDTADQFTALEVEQPVSADPATLGLTLDATRTGPMYLQSTTSHTEWTWKSQHVAGATLPPGLICGYGDDGPDHDCAAESVLMLGYDVDDMRLNGTTPSGSQGLDVTVSHLQTAASSAVTGVTVQYSTDGTTWQDATVTGSGGKYHAAYTVTADDPFMPVPVSLRVKASDDAGSTVFETLPTAYRVSL